jgi:predicted nucleic acid-binding protein
MVKGLFDTNILIAPPTRAFLSGFEIMGLDEAVAETAVELRRVHRIKLPDAIIWATASRQGRLLVTWNTRDFPVADPGMRIPYETAG